MYYRPFYRFLKVLGYIPILPQHPYVSALYPFIILLFLVYPTISTAVQYGLARENILFSAMFFYAIVPVQYLLGLRYMRQNHLKSIILDTKRDDSLIELPQSTKLLIGIIICAFCLVGVNIGIWLSGGSPDSPNSYPDGFDYIIKHIVNTTSDNPITATVTNEESRTVTAIMLIFWIYGWTCLITNLAIFCMVFQKHINDIRLLQEYLEKDLIWKMDQTSFTDLTRKIISIRFVINGSVDKLESLATSSTLLGSVALGPILELKQVNPYLLYHSAIFCLLLAIFSYFIYTLPKAREDILKIIKSPTVMFKYLTNIKSMHNIQVLREARERATSEEEIARINQCKISAYSPIKLGHSMRPRLPNLESASDSMRSVEDNSTEGYSLEYLETSDLSEQQALPDIESSAADLELLTLGYKNNAAIDWMILHSTLSERWASFNLMGVSFDNTDVIKKGIGMISVIVLISSYFNSLSFI